MGRADVSLKADPIRSYFLATGRRKAAGVVITFAIG